MAIVRTYINDSDNETALAKLTEYLQKNAVPEYFSKVENSEGTVSCYIENDILMMTVKYSMYSDGLNIYTKNNTSVNIRTSSSGYTRLNYAYKCGKGIFLGIGTNSGDTYPCALAITKDDAENTTIIAENHLTPSTSSSSVIPIYIINSESDSISQLRAVRCATPDFSKTVLLPFVVLGSKGNYTPDVFIQFFEHNTEQGTLEIDGIKYFSNGLWCIKDE